MNSIADFVFAAGAGFGLRAVLSLRSFHAHHRNSFGVNALPRANSCAESPVAFHPRTRSTHSLRVVRFFATGLGYVIAPIMSSTRSAGRLLGTEGGVHRGASLDPALARRR
jgi:hypothetical protein